VVSAPGLTSPALKIAGPWVPVVDVIDKETVGWRRIDGVPGDLGEVCHACMVAGEGEMRRVRAVAKEHQVVLGNAEPADRSCGGGVAPSHRSVRGDDGADITFPPSQEPPLFQSSRRCPTPVGIRHALERTVRDQRRMAHRWSDQYSPSAKGHISSPHERIMMRITMISRRGLYARARPIRRDLQSRDTNPREKIASKFPCGPI
jgi:hypothetical protein